MAKVLFSICLLFCSLLAQAVGTTKTQTMDVDPRSASIVVTLPSNPTTGYKWSIVRYDDTVLKWVSSKYVAPATKLVGAGGNMLFTFKVITTKPCCPASTHIVFQYARPWESKENISSKDVVINFKKVTP